MKFETINKSLLLAALISLVFRKGSFYNSLIPKPFELLFFILLLLTAIYVVKYHKIKEFFLSIPKKIWVAVGVLLFSIFIGWSAGAAIVGIHSTFNTVLEFGTFAIGLLAFVLVLFYTKNDPRFAQKYLYALLAPVVYIIFLIYHQTNYFIVYADHQFLTFTLNPNVISKILLIPTLFFISKALCETKNSWLKIVHMCLASMLAAVLFLTVSRGAILSMSLGALLMWIVYSTRPFNWKKALLGGCTVVVILSLGFAMTPRLTKYAVLGKFSHTVTTIDTVILSSDNKVPVVIPSTATQTQHYEPRLIVWSFFSKYALMHPLGVGPNTHADFHVIDREGHHLDLGPDNTYLQIWVWGGLLGIMSFLYLLWSAFASLWLKLKKGVDATSLALLGILTALSIAIFFDAILSFYWFFIILALSLRKNDIATH